jgi:hypothetical protein
MVFFSTLVLTVFCAHFLSQGKSIGVLEASWRVYLATGGEGGALADPTTAAPFATVPDEVAATADEQDHEDEQYDASG